MAQIWFSLADCPIQGRRLSISDQNVWSDPLAEFDIRVDIVQPLVAELFVVPQSEGLFVQGQLQGRISLICDRCSESMSFGVNARFDVFETLQGKSEQEENADRFRQGRQGLELDLAAVLWEQFVLALPIKPLCAEDCRGICPHCGMNLNRGDCGCVNVSLDPRLEVLRRLQAGKT
ncbi:MAG: DUF177 domain-containing protein [Desulfovermiculus sp.]|nr:DUF177 domain-containing protein [Desulfovermiculus sp.]